MSRAVSIAVRHLPAMRRMERFKADPAGTQTRLLRRLLRRAQHTEWGRRFDFGSLARSADPRSDFRDRVPVHNYEAFRADVQRMQDGAADVSWPGRIRHFAVSSGTASAGTVIPLTSEMLKQNRDFSLGTALAYTAESGRSRIWGGRLLSIPGRVERDPAHPDSWIGEVSGLTYLFAPWIVRRGYQAVSRDILFMEHWERKLDAIVERTRTMDIRAMVMVPSWSAVLFRKLIARHNAATGDSVRTVGQIWPNLQVFFSGGVALSSYRMLLAEQIGLEHLDFVESYGASEGFFSFQDEPAAEDMLLHLDCGVYFEFIRMDDAQSARRYGVDEVEPGIRYRMIVSTCSGLWAYAVGDVVVFTSTRPHRIRVAGRTAEVLDRYGEAVFSDEARDALESACAATGYHALDYHVAPLAPEGDRPPGHEWLIEFLEEPADPETLSRLIDAHLQRVNRHYIIRREAGAFAPPRIVPLPAGTFMAWLQATRQRVGAQTKVPRMRDDRTIADGVLQTADKIAISIT